MGYFSLNAKKKLKSMYEETFTSSKIMCGNDLKSVSCS